MLIEQIIEFELVEGTWAPWPYVYTPTTDYFQAKKTKKIFKWIIIYC